ncbi:hypothetical protein CEXT_38651 [Caerostris extrusa]|uniref:Uncharacterized protein n=1 Tax=Caerostris extrusa TaxID=172846 RepID=A0AAV4PVP9_CAEEX|nr:hypothetical protein CEXT_38651 [Caerostris extrusa]
MAAAKMNLCGESPGKAPAPEFSLQESVWRDGAAMWLRAKPLNSSSYLFFSVDFSLTVGISYPKPSVVRPGKAPAPEFSLQESVWRDGAAMWLRATPLTLIYSFLSTSLSLSLCVAVVISSPSSGANGVSPLSWRILGTD